VEYTLLHFFTLSVAWRMNILMAIGYATVAAELIPIYAGYKVRDALDRPLQIMLAYLISSFLTDILLFTLSVRGVNNLWVIRLYTPFEFGLIMLVFHYWQKESTIRRVILWSIPVFLSLALLDSIVSEHSAGFNAVGKAVSAIAIVIVSSYTLFQLRLSNTERLASDPTMWISVATLLHFGVGAVVYVASNLLMLFPKELALIPWTFKAITHTAASVIFAKGFLCLRTK